MNTPDNNLNATSEGESPFIYGLHISLEGGEEWGLDPGTIDPVSEPQAHDDGSDIPEKYRDGAWMILDDTDDPMTPASLLSLEEYLAEKRRRSEQAKNKPSDENLQ